MEKHIADLFNESYLEKASKVFGFNIDTLEPLKGFENILYSYIVDGEKFVLRVSHKDHQPIDQTLAEIEFLHYLKDNGANVVTPILSENNLIAEDLGDGFTAVGFIFSSGRRPNKDDHSEEFYREYGRSIARLHKLAVDFNPEHRRFQWDEVSMFSTLHKTVPKEHSGLMDQLMVLMDRLSRLPKTEDAYGLIHNDVHMGNFFVNDGKLEIFDFDDASYMWFISDISIVLFYMIQLQPENTELIDFIMTHFMEGYNEIYYLDDYWFDQMDEFLKFRRIVLLLVMYRSFDLTKPHPYFDKYSEMHLEKCKRDLPMTTVDYKKYNKKSRN